MGAQMPQLGAEYPQRPQRHRRVQQAEEHPRAHQAQVRHKEQREGHGDDKRAQVVESQHLRHQFTQTPAVADVALEDAHDERNLQPHQRAHQAHQPVQQHPKRRARAGPCRQAAVGDEQQRRHQAADKPHQQLDAQKLRHQLTFHKAAEPAANAHRKQVAADDGGKLQHRVAQQITGQCTGGQFIHQPAGGDDEDRGQQGQLGGRDRRGRACGSWYVSGVGSGARSGVGGNNGLHRPRVTQALIAADLTTTLWRLRPPLHGRRPPGGGGEFSK